jgi:MYXO-CTERM domain-containing protein
LANGLLTGRGTVIGNVTVDGGTVAPGSSLDVISIDGALTLLAESLLEIELAGTQPGEEQFDQLQVAGAVTLGGMLRITLVEGYMPVDGDSFDVLNWTTLSGQFSVVELPPLDAPLTWNRSQLYITGTLSVIDAVPGDFDSDGDVDGADFVAWQSNFPKATGATLAQGDADSDGDIDGADFVVWQTHFPFTPGSAASPAPEPTALILALAAVAMLGCRRRRAS